MKRLLALFLLAASLLTVQAQTAPDPVIFEIGGHQIRKSEFMREFLQSIGKDPAAAPTACTYEKRQALEEYVNLFVNYRLKLADAYALGFDTAADLRKELAGYRNELAAPYLVDSASMQQILRQAYERNHYVVHAAHILVPVSPSASASDTLRLYQKALDLRRRVTTGGENFNAVAKEMADSYMSPEEREAQARQQVAGHEGDLGYFTVFDMVFPFEQACYTLPIGEISMPVRSQYGYHIIRVLDRTPYYGSTTLRHIWISARSQKGEGLIHEAYNKLLEGQDFERVARNYSDDTRTNSKGGMLGTLTLNQLPAEYTAVIGSRQMKAGDISEPFRSEWGWHIIKVEHRDTIPPFIDLMPSYRQRLSHDQRNQVGKETFAQQAKTRYNLVDHTVAAATTKGKKKQQQPSLDKLSKLVTPAVFVKQWVFHSDSISDLRPLFSIGDKSYNAVDLGQYIAMNQQYETPQDVSLYVKKMYGKFTNDKAIQYADSRLEEDNEEFRALIDEYRHGLMIFNYTDSLVWSKASSDTAGFRAFYEATMPTHTLDNASDSVYFWNRRARVTVFTIADSACLQPDKAIKVIAKGQKKNRSSQDIRLDLLEKVDRKLCRSEKPALVRTEMVEDGNQVLLAKDQWRTGFHIRPLPKGYEVLSVEQVLPPMAKSINEARGYYVNDYQNYVEQQLIERLREKYNLVIHQDVIDEITY